MRRDRIKNIDKSFTVGDIRGAPLTSSDAVPFEGENMRRSVSVAITAFLSTGLLLAQGATAPAALDRVALTESVRFPEGVAFDAAHNALYTASADSGMLVRIDLKTRQSQVAVPAGVLVPAGNTTFPAILGMKVDGGNRIWIAGGRTGKMFIVDAASGKVLKQFQSPSTASLINDVAVVGDTGYFTDTFNPMLWRVRIQNGQIGELESWLDLNGSPIAYGTDANLNGIWSTPDGRSLIVVQMAKGLLFRIDIATKQITPIETGGADLSGSDGLVLDGLTLYVVRQPAAEIVTVSLSADMQKGIVVNRFKDPALAWPATAAKVGDQLIVVNTQFNTRNKGTPAIPFTLVMVPLARLAGR
jgi:sugar lactone lactonase YvrE